MADKKIVVIGSNGFPQQLQSGDVPVAPTATAGTNTTQIATTAFVTTAVAGGSICYASPSGKRLSAVTGVPVPTTDQTSVGTIYFTTHVADYCLVPNSGATDFEVHAPGELSIAVSGTGITNLSKDIFLWNDGGTLRLQFSSTWTNENTRADAITTLKGIQVNNATIGSMPAKRGILLGWICFSGTNVTEDSEQYRYIYNVYNQVERSVKSTDSSSRSTSSTTPVQVGSVQVAFLSDGKQAVTVLGKSCCYVNTSSYGILCVGSGSGAHSSTAVQSTFGSANVSVVYADAQSVDQFIAPLGRTIRYLLMSSYSGSTIYADGLPYYNGSNSGGKPGTVLEATILC